MRGQGLANSNLDDEIKTSVSSATRLAQLWRGSTSAVGTYWEITT